MSYLLLKMPPSLMELLMTFRANGFLSFLWRVLLSEDEARAQIWYLWGFSQPFSFGLN